VHTNKQTAAKLTILKISPFLIDPSDQAGYLATKLP